MKKLTVFLFIAASVLVYSCSKDQKVVKNLEGTWNVSSITIDGVADTVDFSNDTYEFELCKLKDGDCSGTLTSLDPSKGEVALSFTYSIEDDGETLNINLTDPFLGTTISTVGTILENTDSTFSWSETAETGEELVYVLTKQ